MSNEPDEETRAFVRALFRPLDEMPRDIVPGPGLTIEALDRQNANQGWNEVTVSGEITIDVDGNPTGVDAPVTRIVDSTTIVSAKELERLGFNLADAKSRWPNLKYVNHKGESK